MAWGLFPIFYAAAGLSLERIGWLAAIYPAVWGLGQLFTGALSDRVGRKWLIVGGMWVQAAGIVLIVLSSGFLGFAAGAVLLGAGTAMVYPTLLAAIGDVAHPAWRASSVGVYRLWRDLGYAVGAVLAGITADLLGIDAAIWLVAAMTFLSGAIVAVRMQETLRRPGAPGPCISPEELNERLRREEAIAVVDVRGADEYASAHVDGAVNLPLDTLIAELPRLRRAPFVVTVCTRGGGRSERAAQLLREHGVSSVRSLCGGVERWQARGRQTAGGEP